MKAEVITCSSKEAAIEEFRKILEEVENTSEKKAHREKIDGLFDLVGKVFDGEKIEHVLETLCLSVLASIAIYSKAEAACESEMLLNFIKNMLVLQGKNHGNN